jgi:hypothetical protein
VAKKRAKKRAKKTEQEVPAEVEQTGGGVAVAEAEDEGVELLSDEQAKAEQAAAELSDRQRAHYDEIRRVNEYCIAAGYEYEDRKADAAHAKKRYEQLQGKLNSLISQGPNPQKELPFAEEPTEPIVGDAWKDTPISDAIELTDKQFDKLEDIGVRTVGQFEHLRSGQMDGFPDGLRSVKGVGEKTVDAWEDQIVNWLAFNTREPEAPEDQAAADTEMNDAGAIKEEE